MNFEEWYQENKNKGICDREWTPTHEIIGSYPGFFKDKLQDAYNAGLSEMDNKIKESTKEKDVIIKFLKKELTHKTCYRQVMKRQYRELKQQMKSDNERHTKMYAELVMKKQSITWHYLEGNPKDLPRNEGWVCNQDGLPCWYDITNDQWIDCEGTQIKTTAWCDMPHTRGERS